MRYAMAAAVLPVRVFALLGGRDVLNEHGKGLLPEQR